MVRITNKGYLIHKPSQGDCIIQTECIIILPSKFALKDASSAAACHNGFITGHRHLGQSLVEIPLAGLCYKLYKITKKMYTGLFLAGI